MLTELRIENFAIIDRLELHFRPGLITFTGETGAGKSIIIDAVETVLGGRAEASLIRSGSDRASIEATFQLPDSIRESINAILRREELLDDPAYTTIAREIRAEGRSVARVNGRTVNVALLRELGEHLVDVHGQSDHLSLLRVREHLSLLDRFASVDNLLSGYSEIYHRLMAVRQELKELRLAESEAARRMDLLNYQINEIESAHLQVGEEQELAAERTRLANAENLANLAQQALVGLDEGTPESPSVIDLLGQVLNNLRGLTNIDASKSVLAESTQEVFSTLADIARDLRTYVEKIEFNPQRLDQVEERLNMINNLKRKYGNSIQAILDFAGKARRELDAITHVGERIAELRNAAEQLLVELGRRGEALSNARKLASETLRDEIEGELADLHMSGAQFSVDFQQHADPAGAPLADGQRVAFTATGLERVEYLIAPNPGEGFKPLVKIASGGETSRLMLALKNVLARADQVPTLIFDEIDQGIGGHVGGIVGQKLWRLARHHQVLCVTHLPQLAAYGEQHLQVKKQIQGGRTLTLVDDLNGDNRIHELAQMLGQVSARTMDSAREMLKSAQDSTR